MTTMWGAQKLKSKGISLQMLRKDLNLKIVDFGEDKALSQRVRGYYNYLRDYLARERAWGFVHTREYF